MSKIHKELYCPKFTIKAITACGLEYPELTQKDWSKVTCKNCIRTIKAGKVVHNGMPI